MIDLLMVLLSYIIGSLPSAYIAGRLLKGVDIRKVGDRNAGAANVYRNISHKAGIVVLIADIAKGAVVILIAQMITTQPIVFLCGLATVAGHNWPIFIRFKGGRGEATTLGVFLTLVPKVMIILLVVSVLALFKTRNLLLTGAILFAPLPLAVWALGAEVPLILYSIALPCLVGLTHFLTTRHVPDEAKREARRL